MVILILVLCRIGTGECIEKRPMLAEPLNPVSCMIAGQQLGAAYVRQNPGYLLRAVRCQIGEKPVERAA